METGLSLPYGMCVLYNLLRRVRHGGGKQLVRVIVAPFPPEALKGRKAHEPWRMVLESV